MNYGAQSTPGRILIETELAAMTPGMRLCAQSIKQGCTPITNHSNVHVIKFISLVWQPPKK